MKLSGRIKGIALAGVALAAVAFSTSDVFAAVSWSPQNTVEPVSVVALNGNSYLQFTDNKGNWTRCTSTSGTNVESPGPGNSNTAVAETVNSAGTATQPPSFSGCSSNLGGASVSCSTFWDATATSTTSVDVSNVSCSISIGGICTISMSNVTVKSNTFDNTTSTLTANSTQSFPISESGLCDGATSATETGKIMVGTTAGGVTIV